MSNKQRQVQYPAKQPRRPDPAVAPPRYQPPPLPPLGGAGSLEPAKDGEAGRPSGEGVDPISGDRRGPARRPYPPTVPNLKLYPLSTRAFPLEPQTNAVRRHDDENINRLLNRPVIGDGTGDPARAVLQRRSLPADADPPRAASRGEVDTRPVDGDPTRLGPETLKFAKRAGLGTDADAVRAERARALADELRALREANARLGDDNRELRDLCCFLDDDRQKGRKLAREWQRFGRYTASVMRQEVAAYQSKLRELDDKQQELIRDNLELKELCLYLDEERSGGGACAACGAGGAAALRDDGDGSSSSTNADEPRPPAQFPEGGGPDPVLEREAFGDRAARYVRSLEGKIRRLEDDKKRLQTELTRGAAPGDPERAADRSPAPSGRPEAVVRALQVLEVRERLEREGGLDDNSSADMDDCEKALVREMCDVVWRKLEEGPSDGRR